VAGKIDEQDPVAGQTAGERCHPDAGGGDAVDEEHRVAGTRLEETHPHGRRRDVDPTLLHVESIRRRNTRLGRPQPGLDTHPRESYAERGDGRLASRVSRPRPLLTALVSGDQRNSTLDRVRSDREVRRGTVVGT
jgi:hypothetical protein